MILELILAAAAVSADPAVYRAIARAQDAKMIVMLQDRQGSCPVGWKMALLAGKAAQAFWIGCWRMKPPEAVELKWEDGDDGEVPVDAFDWAEGKKPVSL